MIVYTGPVTVSDHAGLVNGGTRGCASGWLSRKWVAVHLVSWRELLSISTVGDQTSKSCHFELMVPWRPLARCGSNKPWFDFLQTKTH